MTLVYAINHKLWFIVYDEFPSHNKARLSHWSSIYQELNFWLKMKQKRILKNNSIQSRGHTLSTDPRTGLKNLFPKFCWSWTNWLWSVDPLLSRYIDQKKEKLSSLERYRRDSWACIWTECSDCCKFHSVLDWSIGSQGQLKNETISI